MKKEDLLDTRSFYDIRMLEQIYHNHGTTSKAELITRLNTTPRMLSDHVASLNSKLKILFHSETIELLETRNNVTLKLSKNYSLEEMTNRIIRDGLTYQILDYVFWHADFTMQKMQQNLLVSESTLFRAMNRVNQLLEEFEISIRNNRINGLERDIRHFYYTLYTALNNRDPRFCELSEPHFVQFNQEFETLLGVHYTEIEKNLLNIYWNVNIQRYKTKDLDTSHMYTNIAIISQKAFGRRLIQIFHDNIATFLPKDIDFEITAFIQYISLEHVIPMESKFIKFLFNTNFPYTKPVRIAVSSVLDLLDLKFDVQVHYEFLRYSLYYELSNLLYAPGTFRTGHQLIYTAMKGVYWREDSGQMQFCQQILSRLQTLDPKFGDPEIALYLKNYFTSLILLLLNHTSKVFRIGYYDLHIQSISYYLMHGFSSQIKANFNTALIPFRVGEHYDLVLTTTSNYDRALVHAAVDDPANIVELKDFGTEEDFSRIYVVLDRLVSQYLMDDLTDYD